MQLMTKGVSRVQGAIAVSGVIVFLLGCGPARPYPNVQVESDPSGLQKGSDFTVKDNDSGKMIAPLARKISLRVGQGWPGRQGFHDPGVITSSSYMQGRCVRFSNRLSPSDTIIWDLYSSNLSTASHFSLRLRTLDNQTFEPGIPVRLWQDLTLGIQYIPVIELISMLELSSMPVSNNILYELDVTLKLEPESKVDVLNIKFQL